MQHHYQHQYSKIQACHKYLHIIFTWSSIKVWIRSKGVKSASVQPARKAAVTNELMPWNTIIKSNDTCYILKLEQHFAKCTCSNKSLLYCSYEPNMSAVDADFCKSGGRIPRYRFRRPCDSWFRRFFLWQWIVRSNREIAAKVKTSDRSCLKADRAEIPWSCCLDWFQSQIAQQKLLFFGFRVNLDLNMVLLTGKVTQMLTMPEPHPATYLIRENNPGAEA